MLDLVCDCSFSSSFVAGKIFVVQENEEFLRALYTYVDNWRNSCPLGSPTVYIFPISDRGKFEGRNENVEWE